MSFNIGDRVRTKHERTPDLAQGPYIGTVVGAGKSVGSHVQVKRDDGICGPNTTYWSTPATWVELLPEELRGNDTVEVIAEGEAHIAGLSPEFIDWDAHKDFGRAM